MSIVYVERAPVPKYVRPCKAEWQSLPNRPIELLSPTHWEFVALGHKSRRAGPIHQVGAGLEVNRAIARSEANRVVSDLEDRIHRSGFDRIGLHRPFAVGSVQEIHLEFQSVGLTIRHRVALTFDETLDLKLTSHRPRSIEEAGPHDDSDQRDFLVPGSGHDGRIGINAGFVATGVEIVRTRPPL